MNRSRILILGGSGYIGRRMYDHLGPSRARATHHTRPFPGSLAWDPACLLSDDWLEKHGPFSHALILFGATRVEACARDPEGSDRINITRVQETIRACLIRRIHPVFTSSDVVFDGQKGHYSPEDPPSPLVRYGRQKLTIERFLQESGADCTIVRLPKVYDADPASPGLLTHWWQAIRQGQPIRCAADRIFSPVSVTDATRGLTALIDQGLTGLWHLGGPRAISMAELFSLLLDRLRATGIPLPPIEHTVCRINDLGFLETWPQDISLDPAPWIRATGIQPRTPLEMVESFIARLQLPFGHQWG
ncbi:MAG: sugar nucleotide-binding protein [Magnetococcales bacterium]|nr:sugar nucleotide-binding protein [Magnetococcales bacterium]